MLLASGRSARALEGVVAALELDGPLIAFNGALTFRPADGAIEALDGTTLDRDVAADVLRLAREHGIEAGWFELDGWRVRSIGPGAVEEAMLTDEPPTEAPDLPDGAGPPYKLMCIAVDRGRDRRAARAARPAPGHASRRRSRIRATSRSPRPGSTRRTPSARPRARLGLAPSELAAIGDAENDVAMLREAGVGIAMGNATDAVLAAAAHRTAANDRDGVALAIDALLEGR